MADVVEVVEVSLLKAPGLAPFIYVDAVNGVKAADKQITAIQPTATCESLSGNTNIRFWKEAKHSPLSPANQVYLVDEALSRKVVVAACDQ
jgi:hypothetical protein